MKNNYFLQQKRLKTVILFYLFLRITLVFTLRELMLISASTLYCHITHNIASGKLIERERDKGK